MSKANKPVSESDKVADKLRDSLDMEENKPDTVNPLLGSPVTSLQTQSSGLTSPATTTTSSCTSSSSGSFLGLSGKTPITRKHTSGLPIPPAAQSLKSTTPSAAQLKSSTTSASQSSKSTAPSAPQSSKSNAPSAAQSSKSTAPSASQSSKSNATSAAQSSQSTAPSAAQSSKSTAPSAVPSGSAAQTSKSSIPSTSQSKPRSPSDAKSSKATTPPATKSSKAATPPAAKSKATTPPAGGKTGSTSKTGGKTGSSSSSPKTGTGNVNAGRSSAQSNSASGTAKTSGKSSMAPPKPIKIIPAGNLFPSGIVKITGMTQAKNKTTVLGSGTSSYGYGNIVWPGKRLSPSKATTSSSHDADTLLKKMMSCNNPEEVKSTGNDLFKKGSFNQALQLYDRAIQLSPENAIYHNNRAAALSHLNRIGEAVIACEEAIKLDPKFVKAHRCLASLFLRLGQIDNAGMHFYGVDDDPSDPTTEKMLELVYNHLNKCTDARRRCDWNKVLDAASAAMMDGADSSPQLVLCQVEALLKLVQLEDAQAMYALVPIIEPFPDSLSQTEFFDMTYEAYKSFVKSQLELALGRFENAVTAAEKASDLDPKSSEIKTWYKSVRMITRARDRGNDLYESDRYTEASLAYTEGLRFDPHNAALFCHRADCSFKIGNYETAIEDYSRSLISLPSYVKPRLQRAVSFGKVGKWAEAVSDYETVKLEMPFDKELAESLFHAQVELRKSEGEVNLNMEFSRVVEEITTLIELTTALNRPGVIILHFFRESDEQSKEMSGFMDALCICYPSVQFLKVEIDKYPLVGESEKVNVVPTFKIYKSGIQLKEIVCPSKSALETSIRHYSH